jgi:hypothetical protein
MQWVKIRIADESLIPFAYSSEEVFLSLIYVYK